MQLIISFVKAQMRLRDRADNFCHRSIDLVQLVTILLSYVNTNDLGRDTFDYHNFCYFPLHVE